MKEYRVGSLVKYRAKIAEEHVEYWLGVIVEIRPDHHFRVMWCTPPHIVGLARTDNKDFEVIL